MDPHDLKFIPTHEWVHIDGDTATVGISQFAVEQLTDLLTVELPKVGTKLVPGKSFGEIESVKAVSDLYAPVGGEVVAVNEAVTGDVEALAGDPYGRGWLLKVRLDDPARDVPTLLDFESYRQKVAESPH